MGDELVPVDLPTDLPAIEREIGDIESVMRNNRAAYNRDEGKQTRLRGLYGARDRVTSMLSAEDGADLMAIVSREDFLKQAPGGDYGFYLDYMRQAADVTNAIPDGERVQFIQTLEELPQSVFTPMVAEMMNRRTIASERCSDEQVRGASSGYSGASIVREWGAAANQKLGQVRARLWRMIDTLPSDRDVETFLRWLSALTEGQAKAVYRKLAS